MDIYPVVIVIITIIFLIFLIFLAIYINNVKNLRIPSTTESNILFWMTVIFIVILILLMIYTAYVWASYKKPLIPENIIYTSSTTTSMSPTMQGDISSELPIVQGEKVEKITTIEYSKPPRNYLQTTSF
jgi:heme/copper-type cytochrome/quinol oxidase subunit 2